jgi:hypothetical protein
MKCSLIIFFLIVLSIKSYCQQTESPNYIQIKHTGLEEKPVTSIVLSIEKIQYNFSCDCFISAKNDKENANKKDVRDLLSANDFFKIINESEFFKIYDFLNSQQKYYTNESKKNHGDYDDYAVDINVDNSIKTYNIYFKSKTRFFHSLSAYLQKLPDSKEIIEVLRSY